MKGDLQVFLPGQIIFSEGDDSTGLYFVKEGKIEIFRTRDGVEINLAQIHPGDVLGTLTVLTHEPRTASARTLTKAGLVHVSGEALESALKGAPLWMVAILKDTIARLKGIDEKLCEAKLLERKLINKVGTHFHHASQLAALLAAQTRLGTFSEEGLEIFPLKGFIPRSEMILSQQAEYLQRVFNTFSSGGLVKQIEDKKHGTSLQAPNAPFLEDFAIFARSVAKDGSKGFAPLKLVPYMSALLRLHKKTPKEWWLKKDLSDVLAKDLGRTSCQAAIAELLTHAVLRAKPGKDDEVQFSPVLVQRKIVYEGVCKLLSDCVQVTEGNKEAA